MSNLVAILKEIDELVNAGKIDLGLAAPTGDIAGLTAKIEAEHSGKTPAALVELFQWHNGQDGDLGQLPDSNQRLMSVAEAMEAWAFFLCEEEDYLEPYEKRWFPIITNDCSDYLMFDLDSGELWSYWHDDPDRFVEHPSLEVWATSLRDHIQSL